MLNLSALSHSRLHTGSVEIKPHRCVVKFDNDPNLFVSGAKQEGSLPLVEGDDGFEAEMKRHIPQKGLFQNQILLKGKVKTKFLNDLLKQLNLLMGKNESPELPSAPAAMPQGAGQSESIPEATVKALIDNLESALGDEGALKKSKVTYKPQQGASKPPRFFVTLKKPKELK